MWLVHDKRKRPWRGRSDHAVEAPKFAGTSCVTEGKRTAVVAVGQGASGNTREDNADSHGENRTAGKDNDGGGDNETATLVLVAWISVAASEQMTP